MSRHEYLFEGKKYTLSKKKKIISTASEIFNDKN